MQISGKKFVAQVGGRKSRITAASRAAVELIESRVLLSTTLAGWNFDSLAIATNLSPAPSTGTGTALTVGLQASSSNTNSPGGVYAYPNPNASGTGDESDILNGTGNNPTGNQADHSSTGDTTGSNPTGTNPAWRPRHQRRLERQRCPGQPRRAVYGQHRQPKRDFPDL